MPCNSPDVISERATLANPRTRMVGQVGAEASQGHSEEVLRAPGRVTKRTLGTYLHERSKVILPSHKLPAISVACRAEVKINWWM